MHEHVLGDQAQFEPTKGAQPTSYQHTQLEMFCQSGTSKTTGGRHRVDQTDVQVEASEGHGRRCRRQLSDQVNTEQRHHLDQQPGVGRYKPSSQPFRCCDTGDRLTVSPA